VATGRIAAVQSPLDLLSGKTGKSKRRKKTVQPV
jgi:hypothetical protein